jgi:cell division septation protein DedD
MHNNDNDLPDTIDKPGGEQLPGFDPQDTGNKAPREQRREPVFSGFEEEDDYEESDRDTDYASSYHEESPEDEEFDESPLDEDDFTPEAKIEWENSEPDDIREEPHPAPDAEPEHTSIHPARNTEEEEQEEDEWDDEEGYFEDEDEDFQKWPLGLIVVAIVALLLLAAGGYGVIQQRSATQEEIRQLRATLATAASPTDVTASRTAMRETQERNTELLAAVDALTLENRRLADTVTGLESQLEAQQAAVARQAATPQPAAPKKPVAVTAPVKPAAQPATPQPAAPQPATPKPAAPTAVGGGTWFVNFSSYDRRATAEGWVSKIKPEAGKVVVTTGSKGGAIVYRVRVIGLSNRESAEKIARQLESEYSLPKLWVGQQ